MAHPPYHITHLHLDKEHARPDFKLDGCGNYLVYWWKEIPLGQLFLAPGKALDEQAYYQQVAEAIIPALQQYSKEGAVPKGELVQWLSRQQPHSFTSYLENLLDSLMPQTLPAQVPVSVVICTRNRAAHLARCLKLLGELSCQPEEIIVVDNAPSDNSTEQLVAQFGEVSYCKEPRPGLDIARNTGVKSASCPIVCFIDDDVITHPLFVYRVWEAFQQPDTAAITGLVIAAELSSEAQQIFEMHWSFNRGYVAKQYDKDYFNKTLAEGPPVWEIGAGANMAFRREVFNQTGLFDELLDAGAAGCNGDSEMWFRILAHGLTIRYTPLAVVHHEHRKEMEALQGQLFSYMRGFTTAALLQQQRQQDAGYRKHLFKTLPAYYAKLMKQGFPRYAFRYQTLGSEIKGVVSGLIFYQKNKDKSTVK